VARPLQTILDAVLDGIVVLDLEGRVEMVNAEACRILETSATSVVGKPFDRLAGSDHPIGAITRKVIVEGRSAIADEVPIERRFSEDLIVDAAVAPLPAQDDEPGGVVLVLRDRTIQNSLRDALSQREKLASYGHIAAGIAHEVKNPLSGIRGAAELLELRANDDRARQTAGLIVREVDRISSLIDELMVFAKGEELDRKLTNLHRVLDQVLDLVSVDPLAEKVRIERAYDPSIPELIADENRLTQVFLNLARNALQALSGDTEGSEGRLTVRTRVSLDHRLPGLDGRMLPAVVIEFRDDGPGISDEDLERLATPFFTTKSQGTGLGLAVSRHWITQHGGTLDIQSEVGEGSTARVSLPLRRQD
jgi:two-component system nitrogen regulation sensor histidine kinase GlnL